ncbi:MAG: hypothetical protein R3C11_03120 [Planctomycetaceae bacterium]
MRGEAYIRNSDFAEIRAEQEAAGEQVFANPRNATSGALKRLDPTLSARMKLHFLHMDWVTSRASKSKPNMILSDRFNNWVYQPLLMLSAARELKKRSSNWKT